MSMYFIYFISLFLHMVGPMLLVGFHPLFVHGGSRGLSVGLKNEFK